MSDCEELDQTDKEIPRAKVSDEALEAASVGPRGLPTLLHNTYCFACPVDIRNRAIVPQYKLAVIAS
jgi:hypothetical protein